jgi:AcrR family transcriptional regulator
MSRGSSLSGSMTADREALLDATEALVYARGVQAVGMDQIREASGLSLKRIYALFPAKEDLVVGMLRRRDRRWRASLAAFVEQSAVGQSAAGQSGDPSERVLALFDWLHAWFSEPGFRGCAWINIHGELGPASQAVLDEVRSHKKAFRDQIAAWTDTAGTDTAGTADAVYLLAEGAIVTAGISGNPGIALEARDAARLLLARD